MSIRVRRSVPSDVQFGSRLNSVPVIEGLPEPDDLRDEFLGYVDVLLGRQPAPIESPYLQLAEVATAYFARGQEIDMLIHAGEREGKIHRGSPYYRFRTGELRAFLEMAKKCAELGSRRLSQEALLYNQRISN
jgi:hypothetical protein